VGRSLHPARKPHYYVIELGFELQYFQPVNTLNIMKNILLIFTLILIIVLQACKEEEEHPDQFFGIEEITFDVTKSVKTDLTLMYSRNFSTYVEEEELGPVREGTKIWVKVYEADTKEALSSSEFWFDWSKSSPAPVQTIGSVAEFDVKADLDIRVQVFDAYDLVGVRDDGTLHHIDKEKGTLRIDKQSGALKPLFTAMYEQQPITSMQAFVYHPKKRLYYTSVEGVSSSAGVDGGYLYTINPVTKAATRINENNGANGINQWENVYSWVIGKDDSLISIGDFELDGYGVAKFGANGNRARTIRNAEICCGVGMIVDSLTNQLMVANGLVTGYVEIQSLNSDGSRLNSTRLYDFKKFTTNVASNRLTLVGLTRDHDGTIYGIMRATDNTTLETSEYFVKVDVQAGSVTYVSKLSGPGEFRFNSLALVPKYLTRAD
jgi:hypothetical protein